MAFHLMRSLDDDALARLWARACAAGLAVATLSLRPHADDDLALTHAAHELAQAADELHSVRPSVIDTAAPPDIRGDLDLLPLNDARQRVAGAILAALDDVRIARHAPPIEILAIGSAVDLLGLAHYALTGRLP